MTNDENEACGDGEKEKSLLMRNVVKELGELETWLDGIADGSVKPEGHAEESFLSETSNDGETRAEKPEKGGRWVSESFSPFPFSEAIRERDSRDMDTQDTQDTQGHAYYKKYLSVSSRAARVRRARGRALRVRRARRASPRARALYARRR